MKAECQRIQTALADQGLEALRSDSAAEDHIAECADCFALLEAAADLELGLQNLHPVDAPDDLVTRVLAAASQESDPPGQPLTPLTPATRRWQEWILRGLKTLQGSRPLQAALATGFLIVALFVLQPLWIGRKLPEAVAPVSVAEQVKAFGYVGDAEAGDALATNEDVAIQGGTFRDEAQGAGLAGQEMSELEKGADSSALREGAESNVPSDSRVRAMTTAPLPQPEPEAPAELSSRMDERFARSESVRQELERRLADGDGSVGFDGIASPAREEPEPTVSPARQSGLEEQKLQAGKQQSLDDMPVTTGAPVTDRFFVGDKKKDARLDQFAFAPGRSNESPAKERPTSQTASPKLFVPQAATTEIVLSEDGEYGQRLAQNRELSKAADTAPSDEIFAVSEATFSKDAGKPVTVIVAKRPSGDVIDITSAYSFLEEMHATEGLSFKPSQGYWANTYLPGDASLRRLSHSLHDFDKSRLESLVAEPIALHDAARRNPQPFDPPRRSALALYLGADHKQLEGPSRLLLQVGLQATERQAGRRGAMNLGVVVHSGGELDPTQEASLKALLDALAQARSVGDRFELWCTQGDLQANTPTLDASSFRFGPLRVALEALKEADVEQSLVKVFEEAMERLSGADDPQAPLGSSALLLVTTESLANDVNQLERLAHSSAVAGLPVSVIGIGAKSVDDALDRIALAGQGSRRLLSSTSEAGALVDDELAAASRAVARALRLRIRLAKGVQLIDVLGSQPLAEAAAERVREAEKSIDVRLARSLGIRADRGEDEEGLQIVIPAFHSGDAHVILLDLMVPGPGPIADVRVRYKDLAFLKNATARDQLSIPRGAAAPGPLETRVLENRIAFEVQQRLDIASRQLRAGQADTALASLRSLEELLRTLPFVAAELERSELLLADLAMVGEYRRLLEAGAGGEAITQQELADSLHLAAALRLQPPPQPLSSSDSP